jgi:class 3 adenylate cyclase
MSDPSPEAETASVSYLFLDVVGFARNRTVEAQADIVNKLNGVVREALEGAAVGPESVIVLPTGDGMCVGLVDLGKQLDLSLRLSLVLLEKLDKLNSTEASEQRRFAIRIGLNENVDNIVIDFNGKRNVAGAGITFAQRVMDKADGGQILISSVVHDKLRHRERYKDSFREFAARDKHGQAFSVHQFVAEGHAGLNLEAPRLFRPEQKKPPMPIKRRTWFFLALAYHYRGLIIPTVRASPTLHSATTIALYFLASDLEAQEDAKEFEVPSTQAPKTASFIELIERYGAQDYWSNLKTVDAIVATDLRAVSDHFEDSGIGDWTILSSAGVAAVTSEKKALLEELTTGIKAIPPSVSIEGQGNQ